MQSSKRYFGLSGTELTILAVIGGLMLCLLIGGGAYVVYQSTQPPAQVVVVVTATSAGPTPTALAFPTLPPAWTATPQGTATPASTATKAPTQTPRATETAAATDTPASSETPASTASPVPPTQPPKPLAVLKVNQWQLDFTGFTSEPGKGASQQNVVLHAVLTNKGSTGTFDSFYIMALEDDQGRRYTDDIPATAAAEDKYGIDHYAAVSMPPEDSVNIVIAYPAPASVKHFTIVPGDLAGSWSGNVSFTLP